MLCLGRLILNNPALYCNVYLRDVTVSDLKNEHNKLLNRRFAIILYYNNMRNNPLMRCASRFYILNWLGGRHVYNNVCVEENQ